MSSYGTLNPSPNTSHTPPSHPSDTATQPLLPITSQSRIQPPPHRPKSPTLAPSRLQTHFSQPISTTHTDLILLYGYIVTGLLDSTATAIWGSFVSMQTGNTIYFALGLVNNLLNSSNTDKAGSGGDQTRWIKAGVSIACFCAGSWGFARFHRWCGGMKPMRWVMVLSTLVQIACIIAAALVVVATSKAASGDHRIHKTSPSESGSGSVGWDVLLPIGLVGFQSGGQAVLSRVVKFNSLTGVVLTSIYCDLFADAELLAGVARNAERNRRVAAPVLLLVGAMGGGLWASREGGILGALWSAAAMKVVVVAAWVFWAAEKEDGVES